jgi:hypothetical protein
VLSLRVFAEDYARNPLRQDLWRAGHAHAGVFLVLALVVLRYVDGAALSKGWTWLVRLSAPTAATLLPAVFFLSRIVRGPGGSHGTDQGSGPDENA